ncbi:MAG: enoyl-CoA hydratase/isomerase family protein [Nitrospinaceae bacterium]|nr:enoyl-CoA hydratase/isomerase family protein [Nitrospinaceae bacterium]|tara:strand:- start:2 stop:751 length:750 start_codon:yes stop_codon:yes gene_type:complete
MSGFVLIEIEDGVCTIILNKPGKKNALSLELLADLEQNLEKLQNDEDLRAVILQGADGSFSVGVDLADVTGTPADQEIDDQIERVNKLMQSLPVPCLAAIEGPCVGGAVTVALACDALVASENSFFEIPATRLGLLYNPDSVARLHARLGSATLTRLLLFGERLNAQTALQSGMVNWIVPDGSAYEKALEIISKVANSTKAVAATKSLIIALEHGQQNLSDWNEIRNEILGSAERKGAVEKAKKRLGIK